MPIPGQQYIEDLPPKTRIWRFYTPEKLFLLLRDEAVYFGQLKQFEDHQEGDMAAFSPDFVPKGSDFELVYAQLKDAPNFWRSYCGATCWHINDDLSYEMWENYAQCEGAALSTTVERLQTATGQSSKYGPIVYGKIQYKQHFPAPLPGNMESPSRPPHLTMFYKAPQYAEEREYRGLLWAAKVWELMENRKGLNIKVDLNVLIEKLYIPKNRPPNDEVAELIDRKNIARFIEDA